MEEHRASLENELFEHQKLNFKGHSMQILIDAVKKDLKLAKIQAGLFEELNRSFTLIEKTAKKSALDLRKSQEELGEADTQIRKLEEQNSLLKD